MNENSQSRILLPQEEYFCRPILTYKLYENSYLLPFSQAFICPLQPDLFCRSLTFLIISFFSLCSKMMYFSHGFQRQTDTVFPKLQWSFALLMKTVAFTEVLILFWRKKKGQKRFGEERMSILKNAKLRFPGLEQTKRCLD